MALNDELPKLKDVVTPEQFEKMVKACINNKEVRASYDRYVRKEIPYENWVRSMVGYLVVGREEL